VVRDARGPQGGSFRLFSATAADPHFLPLPLFLAQAGGAPGTAGLPSVSFIRSEFWPGRKKVLRTMNTRQQISSAGRRLFPGSECCPQRPVLEGFRHLHSPMTSTVGYYDHVNRRPHVRDKAKPRWHFTPVSVPTFPILRSGEEPGRRCRMQSEFVEHKERRSSMRRNFAAEICRQSTVPIQTTAQRLTSWVCGCLSWRYRHSRSRTPFRTRLAITPQSWRS